MLSVTNDLIRYDAPPMRSTGSVRYAPSFSLQLNEVKIIGYAPRIIVDDESAFLILVSATGQLHYFNVDVVSRTAMQQLAHHFGYDIKKQVPDYDWDKTNAQSFILYPASLSSQPLFKAWSWLTLRGFLKNLNKQLSTDNPMWERLTDDSRAYLSTTNRP